MNTCKRTRYRIKSRRRFFISVMVIVALIMTATIAAVGIDSDHSQNVRAGRQVVVQAGDTVWQLARAYGPEEQDIRFVVREICRINQIRPEQLQVGQAIIIPTQL